MPMFLDTRGRSTLGIGICARCSRKFPLDELTSDPNYPGLRVCYEDKDDFDPWRLPPRPPDRITLRNPRPDVQLFPFSPIPVYANQIDAIALVYVTEPWRASTLYRKGSTVTPLNVNDPSVDGPQYEFMALNQGTSGSFTPEWPTNAGVQFVDGDVTWLCLGIFLLDGGMQSLPASSLTRTIPAPAPPTPPFVETGLVNDGGLLVLSDPNAWPTASSGVPGSLYSNGGLCSVTLGAIPDPLAPPVVFGTITAAQLLALGGANLPIAQTPPGSNQLWNFGGMICVG